MAAVALMMLLTAAAALPQGAAPTVAKDTSLMARQVRHQMQLLPYYSVFDYLSFTIEGGKVSLSGQVLRPTLKREAEAAVKSIEGVSTVVNKIEVLPASAADDNLRNTIYRAIFEDAVLKKYAIPAVPMIHIIVKNGAVALEGTVEQEGDRALAAKRVTSVADVQSVQNNLTVSRKNATE
jgi:hyperosmotically inducible periplasmic protein